MNAIELADKLDTHRFKLFGQIHENPTVALMFYYDCANLLREQTKEIEQLKADLKLVMDELVKETNENAFWHDKCDAQAKQIKDFRFVLRNLTLATSKKIGELEEELEDCTCQGGHSEADLKAKAKL